MKNLIQQVKNFNLGEILFAFLLCGSTAILILYQILGAMEVRIEDILGV